MQCLICGKDSAGEVCNQCILAEQGIYAKDWTYKEGLIVKKTEDFRVNVTNARVNGIVVISTSPNGMNAKIDNFNHYIGCVVGVEQGSYNNKPAPMIHIKTPAGMERYLIFPQMPDEGGLKAGVDKAKAEKMAGGASASSGSGCSRSKCSREAQQAGSIKGKRHSDRRRVPERTCKIRNLITYERT